MVQPKIDSGARDERSHRFSGTQLKAVSRAEGPVRLEGTGLDLGGGGCRHAVFELQRRLELVEADRPAREVHLAPAGLLNVVVEGHGQLEPERRGMSALLLDTLVHEMVDCLPTHDLRADGRGQANLVRDLRDALVRASEAAHASSIAEQGRASASLIFLTERFFWAARLGGGAIFLSRAGFLELLTAGTDPEAESNPIDVLGAPLEPGDTFLLTTLQVAKALEMDVIGRPLREIGDDGESLAAAARSIGDSADAAGVRDGALIIARGV